MKDYYSVLGVSPNVSQEVLEAVYKNSIKSYVEIGADTTEIKEAYKVLSNPTQRLKYDKELEMAKLDKHQTNNFDKENNEDVITVYNKPKSNPKKHFRNVAIIFCIIVAALFLIKNNMAEKVDSSETTANANNSETTVNKPLITKSYNIVNGSEFSEGVAFIECKNGDMYAIDTSGKKLFELNDCDDVSHLKFQNGVFTYNNSLYDKKHDVIASPEKDGYDKIEYFSSNGYIIVSKYVESYIKNTTLYGVIQNTGDWEIQLCESGVWETEDCVYDWENGYLSHTDLPKKGEHTFEECYIDYTKQGLALISNEDEILIDLSKYDTPRGFSYYNGYLLFEAQNQSRDSYVFLLNRDGSFAIEPIKLTGLAYIGHLDENGFYIVGDPCCFIEYNGNIIKYDEEIDSIGFGGFNNGLAAASVYNKYSTDDFYYINYKGEKIIE